jgi:hypothetical protein
VHGLRIHAVLWRKVRSPEEGENIDVTIISIVCVTAKEGGKQYTKRILPPFLIPYCQITREGVLEYLRQVPDGRVIYRVGLALMGARDIRTIRRHISMAMATIGKAVVELAGLLSEVGAHAALPEPRQEQSPPECLEELSQRLERTRRTGGCESASTRVPPMVYLHLLSVVERSRRPLATPLSSVLKRPLFHDTS